MTDMTDRVNGSLSSLAFKAPVVVATVAAITLSGLQTVDGILLADGDRVLVKDQSDAIDNGIYIASSSEWTRAKDFDGNRDVTKGSTVLVNGGNTNALKFFAVTSDNPITIGGSEIDFLSVIVQEIVSITDYPSYQEAVDAVDCVYVPLGVHQVTGDGLELRSGVKIWGAGAGSILQKSDDMNAYVLYAASASDIIIEDLAVDGARSYTNDYENSKFCIYLSSCTDCIIRNVHAYGALADNIVFEYGARNSVVGCHSYDCNKDGIYASGAEDITISANVATSCGSNSTGGGIAVSATWGATVTGNVCANNEQFDILLSRGSRFCTITANTNGSHLTSQSPLSIYVLGEPMGGTLHGVNYGDGSLYYGASDCVISANTMTGEIRLELLADSVVCDNVSNDSNDVGLWLYGCTRVSAHGNRISNYTNTGILVSSSAKNGTTTSSSCTVFNNDMYKSGGTAAAALSKSGTNNTYFGNTLNGQPLETGGSWTPEISSDGTAPTLTYTDQVGTYSVVGDLVFVRARVTVSTLSSAGTGNINITGWPFQSLIKEQAFLTVSRFQQTQNAITAYGLGLGVSSTTGYFYYNPTTTGNATFLSSADGLKSGFSFTVSGCYRIGAA